MTAPANSRPATYQDALAAATALQASGRVTDPVAAVTMMADQIINTRDKVSAWAKTQIQALWRHVNPYNGPQVQAFTVQAASIMSSAQTAASRVAAAGQVRQLAALGIHVSAAPSDPIDVRAPRVVVSGGQMRLHRGPVTVDYAGVTGKVSVVDMSTQGIFNRPAETFRYVQSVGGVDAAQQARQRIDGLIDDNLMLAQRLAQQEILTQAVNLDRVQPKITGYRRVIHPELSRTGTCGLCIAAADRIYHVATLMPIHKNCHCTIAPVTEGHDPGDDANKVDFAQLSKHAGGNTAAHLKRTRYAVDEHGELGPVLVPAKPYTARKKR